MRVRDWSSDVFSSDLEYLRLHVSEVQPEAHMRAAAEGHPRIVVPLARDFGRKAHRVELFGLRPMLRHHMRIGGADADRGARRTAITAIFEISERAARNAQHRGHKPQALLEPHCGPLQPAEAVGP